jgi:hypothetical protein
MFILVNFLKNKLISLHGLILTLLRNTINSANLLFSKCEHEEHELSRWGSSILLLSINGYFIQQNILVYPVGGAQLFIY